MLVRRRATQHMRLHADEYEPFLGDAAGWTRYIADMEQEGNWGDELTLVRSRKSRMRADDFTETYNIADQLRSVRDGQRWLTSVMSMYSLRSARRRLVSDHKIASGARGLRACTILPTAK